VTRIDDLLRERSHVKLCQHLYLQERTRELAAQSRIRKGSAGHGVSDPLAPDSASRRS